MISHENSWCDISPVKVITSDTSDRSNTSDRGDTSDTANSNDASGTSTSVTRLSSYFLFVFHISWGLPLTYMPIAYIYFRDGLKAIGTTVELLSKMWDDGLGEWIALRLV